MPRFPGGRCALLQSLKEYLAYPAEAKEFGIEGTVWLMVEIDESGRAQVAEIVESLGSACDSAAIAAVSQLPRWEPARLNGRPFARCFRLPITFELS